MLNKKDYVFALGVALLLTVIGYACTHREPAPEPVPPVDDPELPGPVLLSSRESTTALFTAEALTSSFVASSGVEVRTAIQVILYVDFTIGNADSMEMRIEFSPDNVSWFREDSYSFTGDGAMDEFPNVYTLESSMTVRLPRPVSDKYMRASVRGTGADLTNAECDVTLYFRY